MIMSTPIIYFKASLICYAFLSLPYVALALDLRLGVPQHIRSEPSSPSSAIADDVLGLQSATPRLRNVEVNSSSIYYNIPEDQREVFYFRNFTMVGKKSEGFDIHQWDRDHGRLTKRSAENAAADGDSFLTYVAGGVIITGVLVAACILGYPGCGTYIGNNIGSFVKAVGDTGGQAAIDVVEAAAGADPGIPAKRDYTEYEGFGCYYQDDWRGNCFNTALTGPGFQEILNSDGSTNTPAWSCWESSSSGTVFGYYSHCFGANAECELQCGVGRPEVNTPYNTIGEPS
jgi:hypothetical protein